MTDFLAGIALFTYHKYRKSIDSPIPLDAHGQPIEDNDDRGIALNEGGYTLARESVPLVGPDEDHEEPGSPVTAVSTFALVGAFRASNGYLPLHSHVTLNHCMIGPTACPQRALSTVCSRG